MEYEGGMVWVLGISMGLLAYGYAGYPVLVWLASLIFGRAVRRGAFEGGVSVLMSAYGEGAALERKVAQLVELAADEPIREIWIGVDGAGAAAERVEVREAGGAREVRVNWVEFEERRGKAAVLNVLMARAREDVLVMMDVRQRVERGAVPQLLEALADERVGVVSGALVYEAVEGGAQKGAESYWGYEKWIRASESRLWAVPGATGALYAIRRELCEPVPENLLVDDVLIPMRAARRGYRCLFEPRAVVWDRPSQDYAREHLRKRRTLAGVWQVMGAEPWLWNPAWNPIWWQWMSHKALRLWTPFLVALAIGSAWGAAPWLGAVLTVGMAASGLSYALARWLGFRLLGLLGAFWGVNVSLLGAAWDAWCGDYQVLWAGARRDGE